MRKFTFVTLAVLSTLDYASALTKRNTVSFAPSKNAQVGEAKVVTSLDVKSIAN